MKKRLIGGLAAVAISVLSFVPLTAGAAPAACVLIKQGNLNIQLGYAPNGPSDCTRLL